MSSPQGHPLSVPPPLDEGAQLFRPGELIADTYEIRGVIGHGGMGQVYDALDRGLARRVAIKANVPGAPSVRVEAQALAAIRHPGVVAVYAFGRHARRVSMSPLGLEPSVEVVEYMVMEHVSGVTLAQHLARLESIGVPMVERIELLIAIADGLAAIHRAGISHGDVKPENIILSASGRVVLTDLGLVRASYEADEGLVAGTPAYMAPELVARDHPHVSWPLVDAYAFGVLAFRVLSGEFPFVADSDLDVVLMHASAPVPSLGERAQVPERLSVLVRELMAKDAHDRPTSMDSVVWQLRAAREECIRGTRLRASDERVSDPVGPRALSVLVVDDDAQIAKLVATYVELAAPDAVVTVVHGAEDALEVFRRSPPRLAFLDLAMPRVSGFELFTYLRGVHLIDETVVVAMSAGGSAMDVRLMLELGAYDFIAKGPKLRERVTRVVEMLVKT